MVKYKIIKRFTSPGSLHSPSVFTLKLVSCKSEMNDVNVRFKYYNNHKA